MTTSSPELLSIGDFSRMTFLTVKALRHYHDVGLLAPIHVGQGTGYRYYSLDQVPTAQVIRRLRNLDMPVADVKAVLATQDAGARNELIAAHLARLESQATNTEEAVQTLTKELRGGNGQESIATKVARLEDRYVRVQADSRPRGLSEAAGF